ncbi:MAG: hypothetical protein LRY71_03305, partial [Bacillaceae bacterium]|nr:hypothetical protein [Bacillaceae bacterium]
HERQALEGRQAEARIWLQLTDRSDLERVGAEARYQSNFKILYFLTFEQNARQHKKSTERGTQHSCCRFFYCPTFI